jgi:predicted TIM-barrel fold metal-dependent hydrolase
MEQHWAFSGNAEHPDLKAAPTEYFRRSFLVAARGDEPTLPAALELAGDENLAFNTDYPHPDGTFPEGIARLLEQPIAPASKRKALWDNAARVFGLEEPAA